jgi:hypothetical protein
MNAGGVIDCKFFPQRIDERQQIKRNRFIRWSSSIRWSCDFLFVHSASVLYQIFVKENRK